jgi:hypothetical protein
MADDVLKKFYLLQRHFNLFNSVVIVYYLKNWTKIQGISIQLMQMIESAQEKWSNDSTSFSNKKVVKLVLECD